MANATIPVIQINEGNVGIGTTSPANKLVVSVSTAGDYATLINNTNSTNGYGLLARTASTGTSSYAFAARAGSSDIFVVRADGNVGIGTASPGATLQIGQGSANVLQKIHGGATAGIQIFTGGGAGTKIASLEQYFSNEGYLGLKHAGTTKIHLRANGFSYLNGGNVGIGTTAINGAFGASNTILAVKGKTSGGEGIIQITGLGNNANDNVGALAFHSYNEGDAMCSIRSIRGSGDDIGNMVFLTNNGGTESERMRISSAGEIKFNAYNSTNNTGTPTYLLGTDASGNVVKTNTVPGSGAGPYLPLTAGSSYPLTGDLYIDGNGSQNFHSLIFHRYGSSTNFATIGFSDPAASNSPFLITSSGNGNEMIIEVGAGDDIEFRSNDNSGTTSTFASIGSSSYFTGNVGIGATGPDSPLEVQFTEATGTAKQMLHIDYNSTNNYGSGYLKISAGGSSQALTFIEQVTSGGNGLFGTYIDTNIINKGLSASAHGNINFVTGSSTSASSIVMTIGGGSQKGNVGIGTTSPNNKLDVNGDVFINSNYTANIAAQDLTIGKTTTGDHGLTIVTGNANTASIFFADNNNNDAGRIKYQHSSNSMRFDTNRSEAMRINSSGNVGIGTTSPVSSLNITTTKTVALDTAAKFLTLGLTVDDLTAGNTAGGGGGIAFRSKNTNAGTQIVFGAIDAIKESANVSDFKGSLRFFTNQNSTGIPLERMRIDSSGNVGIGTTSPVQKLQVNGSVYSNGGEFFVNTNSGITAVGNLIFKGHNGTSYFEGMRLASTGNVGIGVTGPTTKLDVGGSVRIAAGSNLYFTSSNTTFKIQQDTTNSELDIYGGALVPAISIDNSSHLALPGYGLSGSGTPIKLLGLDSSSNVVTATSFNLILDDTPAASTTSGSGNIVNWSVSETVTAGTLYAVKTNGGWTTADADSEVKSTYMLAIALGSNATAGMLLQGFFYKSSHGFTIGAPLYVSNTAGSFSNSRPTGSGDYVRIIGYATSANYIYFDPDKTWIKLT